MSDDFFNALDQMIGQVQGRKQADRERIELDLSHASRAVAEAKAIASSYAAKLRVRGFSPNISGAEHHLSFDLRWNDSAVHGLALVTDPASGHLKIVRRSTDHTDGRQFSSTSGLTYNQHNWTTSIFEDALRATIDEYVRLSERHGGIA